MNRVSTVSEWAIGRKGQRPATDKPPTPGAIARWRPSILAILVYLDAFRLNPIGFLQAVAWRARGLKLRSRHRFAALAGRSRRAYDLWVAREEPRARAKLRSAPASEPPSIMVVIDCRSSADGLDDTLEALDLSNVPTPVVVIGPAPAGVLNVAHPRELAALAASSDIWLCPVQPGDRPASGAIGIYSAAIDESTQARIIYGDDDLIDRRGTRHSPHFKPDWNSDLFQHHDFVTGAAIVRAGTSCLKDLPDQGWQRYLVEIGLTASAAPRHLPFVLHHRRARPVPSVPAKPVDVRRNAAPSVTVIVPTRNKIGLLRTCIDGLRHTAYPQVNIIIVDNESDESAALQYLASLELQGISVLPVGGPFNFSALNNAAVRTAQGDLLCFLNNDVEILDPDWLSVLVRQAVRRDIGAVGARLLYPDRTIQHAGVCTGIGGGAGHAHRFQREDEFGYFERARLPQRVSAVTAACLVVARDKFLAVGGFDEELFPVAFNDVDLCLKLNARGWQSFYEPRATLIHHESKSRGKDRFGEKKARLAAELAALKRRWHTDELRDPFHHPHLSPFTEQFVIAV